MIAFHLIAAIVLALSLALGLVRIFRGPTLEDRMMSVQLVGTTGVGILLLTGPLIDTASSVDLAMLLALLGAVSVAALTRRERVERPDGG